MRIFHLKQNDKQKQNTLILILRYPGVIPLILLVSSSFSDEQNDQWKQFTYDSGYLIGPHAITLRIDFQQQIQSISS